MDNPIVIPEGLTFSALISVWARNKTNKAGINVSLVIIQTLILFICPLKSKLTILDIDIKYIRYIIVSCIRTCRIDSLVPIHYLTGSLFILFSGTLTSWKYSNCRVSFLCFFSMWIFFTFYI